MRRPRITLIPFVLVATLPATAALAAPVECRSGAALRTVEVVHETAGVELPCAVVYEKVTEGGGPRTLWRAANEAGYCEARAREFVARLGELGWTCAGPAAAQAQAITDDG